MKHIKLIEDFNGLRNITLDEIDFRELRKRFVKKLKEENLKIDSNNIYFDLALLKKDRNNSFVFNIVKEYLIVHDIKNIMYVSSNFFSKEFGKIVANYKANLKKEFEIKNKKENNYVFLSLDGEVIKVPSRIGHNYIPLKILPLDELHTKYRRHRRLKTFHVKGLKCVNPECDKVGKYLIATKDRSGSIHIDLYTENFELMTVDHIKPKSLGGTYDIENLNPMCQFCNTEKSDKWE
jgi:hypothetical protein